MAQQDTEQDKSEQATPFKLEEARRQGQVYKSPELNSIAVLAMGLLTALAFSSWAISEIRILSGQLLADAGSLRLTQSSVAALLSGSGTAGLMIVSPLLLLTLIGGVLANFLQTGPVFSFAPMKPDFKRINPSEGFKRVFSMRSVYEGGKAIVKIGVLIVVLYLVIKGRLPDFVALFNLPPSQWAQVLVDMSSMTLFLLLLAFLGVALLDYGYARWEYLKKMRMSRRDLKEEFKRREGDPLIRSKRREAQRALLKRSSSAGQVKNADVLITNPVHIAVALQYRRGKMHAPKVVAKGAGELALTLRGMAFRYGVTIVENRELARDLYRRAEIDQFIPEDRYEAVARILRRIADRRRARRG